MNLTFSLFFKFTTGTIIGFILGYFQFSNDLGSVKFNSECKTSGFLHVSVLTANSFIHTRAKAINETWANNYEHILYFSQSKQIATSLPVVFLPKTDDLYPPQIKAFTMLKFLYENYLDSYEWFLRADDDVYIKLDKLRHFLKRLNSNQLFYIGQPGYQISELKPYCMGGPGIVISRETLRKLGPHLNFCFKKLIKTKHEDVEIGRCIQKFVNISCTSSYENMKLFYHLYGGKNDSFLKNPHSLVFKETISIHPLKNMELMKMVHLIELRHKASLVKKKIYEITNQNLKPPVNIQQKNFKFFDARSFYDLDSNKVKEGFHPHFNDFIKYLNYELSKHFFTINSNYSNSYITSGYFETDPTDNLYLLTHSYLRKKNTRTQLIQNIGLNFPFLDYVIEKEPFDQIVKIHFILSVCNRSKRFQDFFRNFNEIFFKSNQNVKLIIVTCQADSLSIRNFIQKDEKLKLSSEKFIIFELKRNFSRSHYMNQGSNLVPNDEIIFFVDVDFRFHPEILYRIQANTRINSQVYMPIVFSQFNTDNGLNEISNEIRRGNGEWRHFGYGALSIYKKDFNRIKYNENITQWGKEDIELTDQIIKLGNIRIFRSVDPGIVHIYHDQNCMKDLPKDQFQMCLMSKLRLLGFNDLKLYF